MKKLVMFAAVVVALVAVSAATAGNYCPPTEEPPPVSTGPSCAPGYGPWGGKDGDESEPYHNSSCCPDQDENQRCDDVIRPGQTTPNTVRLARYVVVR